MAYRFSDRTPIALACALLLLTACSRTPEPPPGAQAGPATGVNSGRDTAPVAGALPAQTTYEVALKPATRLVDAAAMSRAYRGTDASGALTFDGAQSPQITALKAGDVAIFAGVAVLKVDSSQTSGGMTTIRGTPAGLEDAIDHGRLTWSAPLDFRRMAFNPPPGFRPLEDRSGPLEALLGALVPEARADASLANNSWSGKVQDFDVVLKLTPESGNLTIDLTATKSIAGGTIEVHGTAHFSGLTSQGSITLANGATTEIQFNNRGLKGDVDFTWKVAFDADHGGNTPQMSESTVGNLPFSLDYPILVGPIPFKLSFKAGFAFQPAFSSKVAVAQGSYHAHFGGALSSTTTATDNPAAGDAQAAAPSSGDAEGAVSGDGTIDSYGGTRSLAFIGLSTTVAMPKIVFTLGLPSQMSKALNSPDFGGPYATLMTQANFLASGSLSMVQCEKRELKLLGFVGYKVGLLGKLKLKDSAPKTVFTRTYKELEPPNITLCDH